MSAVITAPSATVAPARTRTEREYGTIDVVWPYVAAVVVFAFYTAVGVYLLYRVGYAIGDAMSRASNARSMVDSRDPKFASLGFVWMPLPTMSELPFMAVLSPLGLAPVALPMATAAFGAATVPVLASIGRRLRLGGGMIALLVLLYALNPYTIFFSANGMSEASFAFFAALACLAYLRWCQGDGVYGIGMLGLVLGVGSFTRYEAVAVAIVFGGAVALQRPKGKRLMTAVVVLLPSAFAVFLWLAVQYVLLGDPFFWMKGLNTTATPPAGAYWLPSVRTLGSSLVYVLRLGLRAVPLLLVAAPLTISEDFKHRIKGDRSPLFGTIVLAAAAVFPVQVFYLLLKDQTWGNPRYFAPLLVFTLVVAMWLVSRRERTDRFIKPLMVAGLALTAVTSLLMMADRQVSAVEGEPSAVHGLLGIGSDDPGGKVVLAGQWRDFTAKVDQYVGPDDLVILDTGSAFPAALFTQHPDNFLLTQDKDFEQLAALDPARRPITMVLAAHGKNLVGSGLDRVNQVLESPPKGQQWTKLIDTDFATLYGLAPA